MIRQKALAVAQIDAEMTVLRVRALSLVQPQLTPEQIGRIKAEHSGPVRPIERPLQRGPGTMSTNHDASGLPPKQ